MKFVKPILAAFLFCNACVLQAQKVNEKYIPVIVDSLMKDIFKNHSVASISVGIKKNGKILIEKSYGLANVELDVPATIHSVYKLNSISKMFTAISVLQLVEQGKLSLDDEIDKWLAGYDSVKKHITIRQLLSHSSGLKDYGGEIWKKNYKSFWLTSQDWIGFEKNEPLNFQPGTSYGYSNVGFDLLAFIVEKASGEKFPEYLNKHIIQPAGLKETGHYSIQMIVPRLVSLYDANKNKLYRADEWAEPAYGSGAIHSSIDDVLKFQDALNKNILLKPASLQQMRTPLTIGGQKFSYGFGTRVVNFGSHTVHGHTGSGGGATSVLHYFPGDDLTIAVLMNSEDDDDAKYPSAAFIAQTIEERIFNIAKPIVKDLPIPKGEIEKYTGAWGTNPDIRILQLNGMLWALRDKDSTRLFYQGDHKFVPDDNHSVIIDFQFRNGQTDSYNVFLDGNLIGVGTRKQ